MAKSKKSAVAEKAEQAQDAVSDAASHVRSAAQDTAEQASEQVKQATDLVKERRGRSGLILALLLLVLGGALYLRSQQSS